MVEGFPLCSAHINPELPPLFPQHGTVAGIVVTQWRNHSIVLSLGVPAAEVAPILLPSLKGSCFDHPLHQGLLHPVRRRSSPTSAPALKLSKKPKVHAAGDMFPTDWSPPPVEFLNLKVPQASRGTPAPKWVGVTGPQGLSTEAHQLPKELEQEPQDLDPQGSLASLEELFWNMAGPKPEGLSSSGRHPHLGKPVVIPWPPLLATLQLPPSPCHSSFWPFFLGHTPTALHWASPPKHPSSTAYPPNLSPALVLLWLECISPLFLLLTPANIWLRVLPNLMPLLYTSLQGLHA